MVVSCTLSSGEDITERRQVEIKLRDSEERFSIAVEGAGHGILDWNIRTGKLLCSRLCMAMLICRKRHTSTHQCMARPCSSR